MNDAPDFLQPTRPLYVEAPCPAAMLINSRLEILQLHGNVRPFLTPATTDVEPAVLMGKVAADAVLPQLQATLLGIAHDARRTGLATRSPPVSIVLHGSGNHARATVTIVAIPQTASGCEPAASDHILLVFEAEPAVLAAQQPTIDNCAREGAVTPPSGSTVTGVAALQSSNVQLRRDNLLLEQTNSELELILNSTLAGIIVFDAKLQVIRASSNCRQLFQLWPDEVSSIDQLIRKLDSMTTLASHLRKALKSGRATQLDVALENRVFTIRLIPKPSVDAAQARNLIVAFYDETARMQQEAESTLLAAIVRNSQDAIIVHDLAGSIRSWNSGAAKLFAYEEADALRENISALIAPGHFAGYQDYLTYLLAAGTGKALETRGVTREGLQRDLSLNASILVDQQQNPYAIAANFRDITEQKRIEDKLTALVESTPDPFIIVEASGSIQRVNKQAEKLFGYSRPEMVGKSFKMLVPERFRSQHDVYTREYQVKPAMRQMGGGLELWCLTSSGEEIPVEIGLSPVIAQGETTIMVRFRDVREQKQEQALLNQARQKADEANRTKSRFLAAASHDLRQPLQSISMNLGVLAAELSATDKTRVIDKTRMALDTTNRLLNALLNITKLEAGKVQPEITTFSIRDVLERVHNTEYQQAREKGHKFSLLTTTAVVTSDAVLLEQLLTNLVANAIKYTPPGGHILVGCRRLPAHLKIQVADNGPGIASDALDLIFDEYHQLDDSDHYRGKGLGLGLSIVKLLAELLQLQLEVKSSPGKGLSFSVLVPLAMGKAQSPPKPAAPALTHPQVHKTLLLIDDDPAVLDSTSFFLSLSGFKVHVAKNSAEALAAVATLTPDLIITDYGLAQQETGIELLARLRAALGAEIPAIVVTGDTSVQRRHSETTAEPPQPARFEIICKPIDAHVMLQLVLKQLQPG